MDPISAIIEWILSVTARRPDTRMMFARMALKCKVCIETFSCDSVGTATFCCDEVGIQSFCCDEVGIQLSCCDESRYTFVLL